MRTIQSKGELDWGLGLEQDPFTVTLFVWETGSRTAMGRGRGSLRRATFSSVQGSPWPIRIRAGTPFSTTCFAWHRAWLPEGCLVQAVFHYEKLEEAIYLLAPVSFFRSSIGSHTPLSGQYSLNASAPSIHLGYQDTCDTLRKVSDCIGQESMMVSPTVSHSQSASSWTNNSYKDSCQTAESTVIAFANELLIKKHQLSVKVIGSLLIFQ